MVIGLSMVRECPHSYPSNPFVYSHTTAPIITFSTFFRSISLDLDSHGISWPATTTIPHPTNSVTPHQILQDDDATVFGYVANTAKVK